MSVEKSLLQPGSVVVDGVPITVETPADGTEVPAEQSSTMFLKSRNASDVNPESDSSTDDHDHHHSSLENLHLTLLTVGNKPKAVKPPRDNKNTKKKSSNTRKGNEGTNCKGSEGQKQENSQKSQKKKLVSDPNNPEQILSAHEQSSTSQENISSDSDTLIPIRTEDMVLAQSRSHTETADAGTQSYVCELVSAHAQTDYRFAETDFHFVLQKSTREACVQTVAQATNLELDIDSTDKKNTNTSKDNGRQNAKAGKQNTDSKTQNTTNGNKRTTICKLL